MELHHLRCFMAVAEELHFARAAQRLHIEQSPLSRAIKELEEELGARLFERNTRNTRLTRAGQVLFEHVPRVFTAIAQARDSVHAVAAAHHDQLRVALSDHISQTRLTTLLVRSREEEPDIEIRLHEVSLAQQLRGLNEDLYDTGFSQSADVGESLIAIPAWSDPLVVICSRASTSDSTARRPCSFWTRPGCSSMTRCLPRVSASGSRRCARRTSASSSPRSHWPTSRIRPSRPRSSRAARAASFCPIRRRQKRRSE